jgi:hypothetical protein
MKTIIHVNQHKIKQNKTKSSVDPVLTCKTYKTNDYRVVYRPDKPLSCGAHCWIETKNKVEIKLEKENKNEPS